MITIHTKYKIPDEILAEAQRQANEAGEARYLAYLRAAKDEPISIVATSPAVGLVAEVTPYDPKNDEAWQAQVAAATK